MGKSIVTHDFKEQLAYSEEASEEVFWDAIYHKAFPNMINHMLVSGNHDSQRQGIDRVVFLSNSRTLYIDEKKRRKDYPDILLEYISCDTTNAPGWIEKDLSIDYLAYAFMPSQRVYLLDWLMLRRAWARYGEEWKATFPSISAQNVGYKTLSVPVPTNTILTSVKNASIIQLEGQHEKNLD